MICVPVNCFRCEPYSYTWSPMPVNATASGNCLIAPPGNYTVCITNACGDVVCCPVYLPPPLIPCVVILDVSVFIEGFYDGAYLMKPVILNSLAGTDSSVCDTIIVELHDPTMPYSLAASTFGILHTDGTAEIIFQPAVLNNDYYIVIRTRNAVETWSKMPVTIGQHTVFDFTKY